MSKIRLDQLVYDRGFTESREKAKAIIMSGAVFVNGQKADKPGMPVTSDSSARIPGILFRLAQRARQSLAFRLRYATLLSRRSIS